MSLTFQDYKPGDRRGYCIYGAYPLPKRGPKVFTKEQCEDFVWYVIAEFKQRYGFDPTTVIVPDDYIGEGDFDGIKTEKGAKPTGHYYAFYTQD